MPKNSRKSNKGKMKKQLRKQSANDKKRWMESGGQSLVNYLTTMQQSVVSKRNTWIGDFEITQDYIERHLDSFIRNKLLINTEEIRIIELSINNDNLIRQGFIECKCHENSRKVVALNPLTGKNFSSITGWSILRYGNVNQFLAEHHTITYENDDEVYMDWTPDLDKKITKRWFVPDNRITPDDLMRLRELNEDGVIELDGDIELGVKHILSDDRMTPINPSVERIYGRVYTYADILELKELYQQYF